MFEVHTEVTRAGCRAQARASMAHRVRGAMLMAIALALGTVILYAVGSAKAGYLAIVFGAVSAYALLATPLTAIRLYHSRNAAVNGICITFEDAQICVRTRVEERRMAYDQMIHLAEDSDYLILYVRQHAPIVFAKAEVVRRSAEDLKAFLEEKTGRAFAPCYR